jgi:hypothetical protein
MMIFTVLILNYPYNDEWFCQALIENLAVPELRAMNKQRQHVICYTKIIVFLFNVIFITNNNKNVL